MEGYPASLVYSPDEDRFILLNPSLPVLSSLPRSVYRREVVDNVTLMQTDASNELAFIGTVARTLTLLPAAQTSGKIFDLVNATAYNWTIRTDVSGSYPGDRIITPESPNGVTSFILGPTTRMSCRLESNGVNYHLPFDAGLIKGFAQFTNTGSPYTWVSPDGVYTVYASGCGPGGGGAGCASGSEGGGSGDAGQSTLLQAITVVPGTSYTITVPAGGAGGGPGLAGATAANLTFGALLTLTAGAGGPANGGAYATTANSAPVENLFVAIGENGQGGPFGGGGVGAAICGVGGVAIFKNGGNATGYGAGGGGAAGTGNGSGGNGSGGYLKLEW